MPVINQLNDFFTAITTALSTIVPDNGTSADSVPLARCYALPLPEPTETEVLETPSFLVIPMLPFTPAQDRSGTKVHAVVWDVNIRILFLNVYEDMQQGFQDIEDWFGPITTKLYSESNFALNGIPTCAYSKQKAAWYGPIPYHGSMYYGWQFDLTVTFGYPIN